MLLDLDDFGGFHERGDEVEEFLVEAGGEAGVDGHGDVGFVFHLLVECVFRLQRLGQTIGFGDLFLQLFFALLIWGRGEEMLVVGEQANGYEERGICTTEADNLAEVHLGWERAVHHHVFDVEGAGYVVGWNDGNVRYAKDGSEFDGEVRII